MGGAGPEVRGTRMGTDMHEWTTETRTDYERKGFASRAGFGRKPALLVIDFINGFTDPDTDLGGDFTSEIEVTAGLQSAFRRAGLPVAYTTVAYHPDLSDGATFVKKVPALGLLIRGTAWTEVDARLRPEPGEIVVEKQFASAFFGTDLDARLKGFGVDTLVLTGCTTSGCVRASAIDSMQHGYHTIVARNAVGDRAAGPHEANLFDIDAKYGDVIDSSEVMAWLERTGGRSTPERATDDFRRWWAAGEQEVTAR